MNAPFRRWVAVCVLAFFGSGALRPAVAQTPPPAPGAQAQVPAHQQPAMVHRRRPGLIATGAVVFGLSWGLAVLISVAALNSGCCTRDTAIAYAIPIVGPMAAGPPHDTAILIMWSAAELAGALMLYYGMRGQDVPVAPDVRAVHAARPGPALRLAPLLARDAGGMALTVRW